MNIKRFNGNDFPGDKWVRDILSRVNEIIDYLKRKVGFDRLSDEVTEVLAPLTSVGTDGQVLTSDGTAAGWENLPVASDASYGLVKTAKEYNFSMYTGTDNIDTAEVAFIAYSIVTPGKYLIMANQSFYNGQNTALGSRSALTIIKKNTTQLARGICAIPVVASGSANYGHATATAITDCVAGDIIRLYGQANISTVVKNLECYLTVIQLPQ